MENKILPKELETIKELSIKHLPPWEFLEGQSLDAWSKEFVKKFPERNLIPFAMRIDSDVLVVYDLDNPGQIFLYLTESGPWVSFKKFDSFWSWFKYAVDELVVYVTEWSD